jgi:hypothetical protein
MHSAKRNRLRGKNGNQFVIVRAINILIHSSRCLDFMGTNELMLSDHKAIIDVMCIQGKVFQSANARAYVLSTK